MIHVIIRMKVLPEKQQELVQTLHTLVVLIEKEHGCKNCNFYQDMENRNIFSLIEEWENQEDLDNHVRSDNFSVLLGAMRNLLSEAPDTEIKTVAQVTGIETLERARRKPDRL